MHADLTKLTEANTSNRITTSSSTTTTSFNCDMDDLLTIKSVTQEMYHALFNEKNTVKRPVPLLTSFRSTS